MSLSGRVPLGSTGATYAQLPNETISNITLRAAVVNRIASARLAMTGDGSQ